MGHLPDVRIVSGRMFLGRFIYHSAARLFGKCLNVHTHPLHKGWHVIALGLSRKAVVTSVGCLLLSFVSNAALKAQMTIDNPIDSGIINVEGVQSPTFESKTTQLLVPTLKNKVSSLLPQSLVITNVSGQSIWGLTVIYTYPHSFAPSGHPYKTIVHVAVGGMADANMMLTPNQMVFITPALGIYATSSQNGQNGYAPSSDNSTSALLQRFRSKHPSPDEFVEASVDSIIFEDGTMLGPDAAGYATKINEQIRAERDLITATLASRGDVLMHTLQTLSNLPAQSEYGKQMRAQASFVKGILDTQGEQGATSLLDRLSRGAWFINGGTVRRSQ